MAIPFSMRDVSCALGVARGYREEGRSVVCPCVSVVCATKLGRRPKLHVPAQPSMAGTRSRRRRGPAV
eukprot:4581833-Prymnesium_polylepis.1